MSGQAGTVFGVFAGEPVVLAAFVGVLGSALALYLAWFRSNGVAVERSLLALAKSLRQAGSGWSQAKVAARSAQPLHPAVRVAWEDTEKRVLELNTVAGRQHVIFGSPRDIWSPSPLLGRCINIQLAEAVPNLLVGVGLLLTFLFLTIAITEAMAALGASGQQASKDALNSATSGLLRAAGAKFLTSLAGLGASIVWTIAAKKRMAKIEAACTDILNALASVIRSDAAEIAIRTQLQHGDALTTQTKAQVALSEKILEEAEDQGDLAQKLTDLSERRQSVLEDLLKQSAEEAERRNSVLDELLEQAREQTGTLKRFETDLAVSLASAINSAFTPKFEEMTKRLIDAIDGLSDRLGMMNQDALRKMTEDFAAMLQRMTNSELGQLKDALESLSAKLTAAGGEFAGSANDAAVRLATATTMLSETADTFNASLAQLSQSVDQAASSGREGIAFVERTLAEGQLILQRLDNTSAAIRSAGEALSQISGKMADAVDSIDEMVSAQHNVIEAVKGATPSALAAVNGVVQTLSNAVSATEASMTSAESAMTNTAANLRSTVNLITEGVTEYSQTVSDLHEKMDGHFAKAISSLGQQIESLEGGVEELAEVLSARLPRKA
jgi:hypothetical protein